MAPTDLLTTGCRKPSIGKRHNTYKVQQDEARRSVCTGRPVHNYFLMTYGAFSPWQRTDRWQMTSLAPGPRPQLRSLTACAAHSLNCSCTKSLLSASHVTANCATVWSWGLLSAEYARSLNLTQSDHSHHLRPYDVFPAQSTYPARMTQEGWGGCSDDLPLHVQGNWGPESLRDTAMITQQNHDSDPHFLSPLATNLCLPVRHVRSPREKKIAVAEWPEWAGPQRTRGKKRAGISQMDLEPTSSGSAQLIHRA